MTNIIADASSLSPGPSQSRGFWARRLSCENPFYALSAAFVIHSTGIAIQQQTPQLPLPWLVTLIAGYLLLLAAAVVLIVRVWNVWDDARTIPLILVLLMLELSLTFDDLLMNSNASAAWWVVGAGLFAVLVSEAVLRALPLKLPWFYRIPFYLQLLLCMLAGAGIAWIVKLQQPSAVRWSMYGFSVLCGLSMLTLIPAARADSSSVAASKCPWIWPIHPWALFVVVWFCLIFRFYLLTLSFDSAAELDKVAAIEEMSGIFGAYLLVPMLLGIGWLLIEAGLAHRRRWLQWMGLLIPFVCVGLSFSPVRVNPAYASFLREFTATVGSPIWCAVWAAIAVSLLAAYRGVPFAARSGMLGVLLLTWIGPGTVDVQSLGPFQPLPVFVVAATVMAGVLSTGRSRLLFESLVWVVIGVWGAHLLDDWTVSAPVIAAHLMLASAVVVATIFRDKFSDVLIDMILLFCFLAVPVATLNSLLGAMAPWVVPTYLAAITLLSFGLRTLFPEKRFWGLAKWSGGATYVSGLCEAGRFLHQVLAWNGFWEFFLGIVLLHIALLGSAMKGRRNSRPTRDADRDLLQETGTTS